MSNVNVSGTMKKDERPFNGLTAISDDLLDETKQLQTFLVVAEVRSKGYKFDAEDGTKTPSVKFLHIEPALDEADMLIVKTLLTKLYATRTGSDLPDTLPFDGDAFDSEGWAKDDGGKKKR